MNKRNFISSSSRFQRGEIYPTSSASHDVYRGTLDNKPVFAQIYRLPSPLQIPSHHSDAFLETLSKPLDSWKKCNHPNVVTFMGVVMLEGHIPSLVIPNYKNGFAHEYLSKNPGCDKLRLISGIAKGLGYLHTMNPPIIHQGVRCQNIVVNDNGEGCLTAVGTSHIHHPCSLERDPFDHSIRWAAPEVLRSRAEDDDNDTVEITTPSEVYSFGMTVLEIYSGHPPFHKKKSRVLTLDALNHEGHRKLERIDYPNIPDKIWSLILGCTSEEPSERPTMDEVVCDLTG